MRAVGGGSLVASYVDFEPSQVFDVYWLRDRTPPGGPVSWFILGNRVRAVVWHAGRPDALARESAESAAAPGPASLAERVAAGLPYVVLWTSDRVMEVRFEDGFHYVVARESLGVGN